MTEQAKRNAIYIDGIDCYQTAKILEAGGELPTRKTKNYRYKPEILLGMQGHGHFTTLTWNKKWQALTCIDNYPDVETNKKSEEMAKLVLDTYIKENFQRENPEIEFRGRLVMETPFTNPDRICAQTNGYDCGVYVALNLKHLAADCSPRFEQTDVDKFRDEMKNSLLNQEINYCKSFFENAMTELEKRGRKEGLKNIKDPELRRQVEEGDDVAPWKMCFSSLDPGVRSANHVVAEYLFILNNTPEAIDRNIFVDDHPDCFSAAQEHQKTGKFSKTLDRRFKEYKTILMGLLRNSHYITLIWNKDDQEFTCIDNYPDIEVNKQSEEMAQLVLENYIAPKFKAANPELNFTGKLKMLTNNKYPKKITAQENVYDCGIYVSLNMKKIIENKPLNFPQSDVDRFREEMKRSLLNREIYFDESILESRQSDEPDDDSLESVDDTSSLLHSLSQGTKLPTTPMKNKESNIETGTKGKKRDLKSNIKNFLSQSSSESTSSLDLEKPAKEKIQAVRKTLNFLDKFAEDLEIPSTKSQQEFKRKGPLHSTPINKGWFQKLSVSFLQKILQRQISQIFLKALRHPNLARNALK